MFGILNTPSAGMFGILNVDFKSFFSHRKLSLLTWLPKVHFKYEINSLQKKKNLLLVTCNLFFFIDLPVLFSLI